MEYLLIGFIGCTIFFTSFRIGRDAGTFLICAIFFGYSAILPVIRPILFLDNGLFFPLIAYEEVVAGLEGYLYAALVFYLTFLFAYLLARKFSFRGASRVLSLESVLAGRKATVPNALFMMMLLVSFGINVWQHGSWSYLLSFKTERSAFELMQATVGGSWYVSILKGAAVYPMLLGVSRSVSLFRARSIGKISCLLRVTAYISIYYLVVRPPTRTELVSAVLACTVVLLSGSKPARQLIGGAVALALGAALMNVVNFLRTGAEYEASKSWGEFAQSLLLNFHQMETAIKLMLSFPISIDWYQFKYLLGAITPLAIIPSALIPFRPTSNKDAVLTSDLWAVTDNQEFFTEGSTVTFGIFASGYADFGFAGVCIAGGIFAIIVRFILSLYCAADNSRVYYLSALITLVGGSRFSVEGVLVSLWTFLLFTIVLKIAGEFVRSLQIRSMRSVVS